MTTTCVALLRGVNVGKNKRIAMADLRALVEGLGYSEVTTHLNSGNVVFSGPDRPNRDIASDISTAISAQLSMDIPVVVRTGAEFQHIVRANPFPEQAEHHTTLHVAFLSGTPNSSQADALADVEKGEDDYRIIGDNVYLFYPNKLTGAVFMPKGLDSALGVIATMRNWRTIVKLAELTSA